jgi:hypothetical protein
MDFLFDKLNAGNTRDLVAKTVTPVPVPPNLQVEIEACS